jgi:hypothetical protein
MTITVHTDRDPETKARVEKEDVIVNGEPLDLERRYSMTVKNFIQKGGDGYSILENQKILIPKETGIHLKAKLIDFFDAPLEETPKLACIDRMEMVNGLKSLHLVKDGRINLV